MFHVEKEGVEEKILSYHHEYLFSIYYVEGIGLRTL